LNKKASHFRDVALRVFAVVKECLLVAMDFAMILTIRTSAKVAGVFTTQLTAIQYAIALSDNILFRTVKTIAFHFSPKVIPTRFLLTSDGSNKAL
jgi:prophage antirepressor-like protein